MSGKYRKEHSCLNCGFHVEEHYCSRCGQPNLELKDDFWAFISHSIAHYFHFDNKFFQTLVPLLTKPGKVTLDYLAGKRARYINPVSMYIFVSIVYFLVVPPPKDKSHNGKTNKATTAQAMATQKAELDRARAKLAQLGLDSSGFVKAAGKAIIADIDRSAFRKMGFQEQATILGKLKNVQKKKPSDSLNKLVQRFETIHQERNDSTYNSYMARQKTLPADEKDNFFERYMTKRDYDLSQKSSLLEEQMERNRSKQYFLFMPLMALFVMVNFRKNHIRYLDHLIFTIHGMTAFFLVSIITQPTKRLLFGNWPVISGIVELALLAWICWYLYQSLRIFYQRKASTTFWRMVWIVLLYGITLQFSEAVIRNILYYMN